MAPTSTPDLSPGSFYGWLFEAQIEPAFRRHPFVRRALVLGIPRPWRLDATGKSDGPIRIMIVYSRDDKIRLSELIPAYTHGTQDPNLPDGVGNYDLFEPIADYIPVEMCPPSFFVGGEIDVENDDGGVFAAFFVYARFRRVDGRVVCEHRDDRMGERMGRFFDLALEAAAGTTS